jgi:KRAB domain-containing zinc finger protein
MDYVTTNKSALSQHIRLNHMKKDKRCNQCSYVTASSLGLLNHINSVHKKIKDKKCPHCDYASFYTHVILQHVKQVHDKIRDVKCDQCSYRTSTKSMMKSHMKSTAHDRRKCEVCDHVASSARDAADHIREAHF